MKNWWIGALGACAVFVSLALQGCAADSPSRGIAGDGKGAERVVFPHVPQDGALRKPGRTALRERLRTLHPGMAKDQVFALLGTPQFDEGVAGVREWDYLYEFKSGGGLTSCQLKLLFDADYRVGSLRWSPAACDVFLD